MYDRRPCKLSQSAYQKLQEIHRENERLRQIDQGLGYRRYATRRTEHGMPIPLHIGPEIELTASEACG